MNKFTPLFSGSSGNSYIYETENTKILIDAGKSGKKITEELQKIDIDISKEVDAILLTHEHTDHIQSFFTLSKRHNIPVYLSNKLAKDLDNNGKIKTKDELVFTFEVNNSFELKDVEIYPYAVSHDAIDPCIFILKNINTNKEISIITDLGLYNDDLFDRVSNSDLVVIESNFEPSILQVSSYPYYLKKRISSEKGHLSNEQMAELLEKLAKTGVKNFIFGHLSKESNHPDIVDKIAENTLKELDLENEVNYYIAPREEKGKTILI